MLGILGTALGIVAVVAVPVGAVLSVTGALTTATKLYKRYHDYQLQDGLKVRPGEGEPYITRLEFRHTIQVAVLGKAVWYVAWTDAEFGAFCRLETEIQFGKPEAIKQGLDLLRLGEWRHDKLMARMRDAQNNQ